MKERIKKIVIDLHLELAFYKQALSDRSEEMSQQEIDRALDRISAITDTIQKLEEELIRS